MQGGLSADPDVQAIVDQAPAELRIALRGWVGFLESACLDWLAYNDLPKARLVDLLATTLKGVIRAATRDQDLSS